MTTSATPDGPPPPRRNRRTTRERKLLYVTAAIAALAVAGLVASLFIRSPAEQAASAAPPPPTTLTAEVEQKPLVASVVLRGTVQPSNQVQYTPITTSTTATQIVSGTPVAAGTAVNAGEVILQVSGRPVFALAGNVPAYRDLKPGMKGADVEQLQQALAALGHPSDDDAGIFGASTKQALTAFYEAAGYEPVDTGAADPLAQSNALRTAEQQLLQARQALSATKAAASTNSGSASDVTSAQQAVDTASSALDELQASIGPTLPANEALYVSSFPAYLEKTAVALGGTYDPTSGPLLTVDTGALEIIATLPPDDQDQAAQGQTVQINDDADQRNTMGTLTKIGGLTSNQANAPSTTAPGSNSDQTMPATPGYPLTIKPDTPLDRSWLGKDVRLTMTRQLTPSAVLLVPVTAIDSSVDGKTSVTVLGSNGKRTEVQVQTGPRSDGYVAVTPDETGALKAGSTVVIG